MGFFEGLIKIFPELKKIQTNIRIKLFSDNTNEKKVYIDNRTININVSKIELSQKENLSKILRPALEENFLLIEENSQKLLKDIRSVDVKNKQLLDYFRNKIPYDDMPILRACLFLKIQYESKQPSQYTRRLKEDILQRYGDRGNNISNLCTAGYYETIIRPLYEEMSSSDDFSLETFRHRYNNIVLQSPFAIFVGRTMNCLKLKNTIIDKIHRNKKYGIWYLNIHGIGTDNVTKIMTIIDDEEIKSQYSKIPDVESDRTFIVAKIWIKK